jgi:hypothetical protein
LVAVPVTHIVSSATVVTVDTTVTTIPVTFSRKAPGVAGPISNLGL